MGNKSSKKTQGQQTISEEENQTQEQDEFEQMCSAAEPTEFDSLLGGESGFFGGRTLLIQGNGEAILQAIKAGEETHSTAKLDEETLLKLKKLITACKIESFDIKEGPALPDTSRHNLTLTIGQKKIQVSKWSTTTHKEFDALLQLLFEIAAQQIWTTVWSGKRGQKQPW